MADSPINLMLHGHTPAFVTTLQSKNYQLLQQLSCLMSQLTHKKEENLKLLKDIDNQEEVMTQLKKDIENQEKRKENDLRMSISHEFTENSNEGSLNKSEERQRPMFKSLEIPHKRAYLDLNNKSIQSTDNKLIQKKLKLDIKDSKPKASRTYGELYGKQSFSLTRFKLK